MDFFVSTITSKKDKSDLIFYSNISMSKIKNKPRQNYLKY